MSSHHMPQVITTTFVTGCSLKGGEISRQNPGSEMTKGPMFGMDGAKPCYRHFLIENQNRCNDKACVCPKNSTPRSPPAMFCWFLGYGPGPIQRKGPAKHVRRPGFGKIARGFNRKDWPKMTKIGNSNGWMGFWLQLLCHFVFVWTASNL